MSKAEATLALHLHLYKVEGWVAQYPFCPGRKYRFDVAFPSLMLAIEVEGGAHGIRRQYQHDCERSNMALLLGWKVFRFTPADVESGKAIDTILALLAGDTEKAKEVIQRRDTRGPHRDAGVRAMRGTPGPHLGSLGREEAGPSREARACRPADAERAGQGQAAGAVSATKAEGSGQAIRLKVR